MIFIQDEAVVSAPKYSISLYNTEQKVVELGWLSGRVPVRVRQERRDKSFFPCQLSVLTLISVSIPPMCYHSST